MKKKSLGKGTVILLVLAMLFALGAANLSFAQAVPTPGDVASSSTNEKVDVLIGFHGPPNRGLVEAFGGEVYREFTIVDVIAARMTPQATDALARNPRVNYVEPDQLVYAIEPVATQSTDDTTVESAPWGIERVFADEELPFTTWDTSTGSGVAVAILDSGITEHIDLDIAGGYNAFEGEEGYEDIYGHGTHVAGTVAALNNNQIVKSDNNKGVIGVSPEVDLYAVKVLGDDGSGPTSVVMAGIQWAAEQGIPVMNMSLGSRHHSQALQDTCDTADLDGHILVAAAGNSGNRGGGGDNVIYPAKYKSVIAVAASDVNDNRATWSSTGSDVEFIAPGVSVLSTWNADESRFDPQPFCVEVDYECYYYKYGSGTSMSSPHVAGVAALAWAVNPDLKNDQIREILQDTAEDLGLSANHQGYGLVRADLAVTAVSEFEPPATGIIDGTVKDEADAAIEGAIVVVEETDLSAITDSDGYYLLEDVPARDQKVTASAEGYYSQTETVTVVEDTTITLDFVLKAIPPAPTYMVSGKVTDGEGKALEGATVTIVEADQSVETDSEGTYSIYDVEDGTYYITASKDGYSSETKKVTVDSDTTVDFTLVEITGAMISIEADEWWTQGGRDDDRHLRVRLVASADEDPVPDVTVNATLEHNNSSWKFSETTNGNGEVTFSLNNAPDGKYTLKVDEVSHDTLNWDEKQPENNTYNK